MFPEESCKNRLLEQLNLNAVETIPAEYTSIGDMGMVWRLATLTAENRETANRDGRQYQWLDYMQKIVAIILSRTPSAIQTFLASDRYKEPNSIKDEEHKRRGVKYIGAGNKFPKPSDHTLSLVHFSQIPATKLGFSILSRTICFRKKLRQQIVYFKENLCTDISSKSVIQIFP